MDYYPDNRPGHFYVKLPQKINLPTDYQVALTEIQITNHHHNIERGTCSFSVFFYKINENTVNLTNNQLEYHVPCGQYIDNLEFIAALNSLDAPLTFHYEPITKRVTVKIHDNVFVKFNPKLKSILGLGSEELSALTRNQIAGLAPVIINQEFKSIFVYCDLVAHRPVGDANAPLIRTLPPIYDRRDIVHHILERPYYIPLKLFNFDTVGIRIVTDRGTPINFKGGLTILTLHFKPPD